MYSILMHVVHPEHMICRGEDHILASCQHHRLQDVGNLSYIGHLQSLGVFMEYVQAQGFNHGIAHGVLLIQVAGICAGFHIEPCSPFVKKQVDLTVRIISVHDGYMLLYHMSVEQFKTLKLLQKSICYAMMMES